MRIIIVFAIFIASGLSSIGQVPVEFFVGHERASIDIMFFKFFKNREGGASKWLFFNRNRGVSSYPIFAPNTPPLFGFTEAVSYNHPRLNGFAPVALIQLISYETVAKGGIQWAKATEQFTVFTWAVGSLEKSTRLDYFLLLRYSPNITGNLRLFSQLESINTFALTNQTKPNATLRLRLGLKHNTLQWGIGSDLINLSSTAALQHNSGLFIRYEFQ